MSVKNDNYLLENIEKVRYLVPCVCKICNKSFKDLLLGSQHVYKDHQKRPVKNVIENLTWDLQIDLKHWDKLQTIKSKRDMIIGKLIDEKTINQAEVPEIIEIVRRKVNITKLITTLQEELREQKEKLKTGEDEDEEVEVEEEDIDERDFEEDEDEANGDEEENNINSEDFHQNDQILEDEEEEEEEASPQHPDNINIEVIDDKAEIPKLAELLEREIEKYFGRVKRVSMADDVNRAIEGKKKKPPNINVLADQLDYFLGVFKALYILNPNFEMKKFLKSRIYKY